MAVVLLRITSALSSLGGTEGNGGDGEGRWSAMLSVGTKKGTCVSSLHLGR